MGQTADQIKLEIEQARNRLGRNLNELEYRVKSETDWRVHYDRHPWMFLGAAFTGAMALSLMMGRR